ncbi:MAG: hypothetical protein GEV07_14590 [Streptosporangiales bacterium]|nr:hypothetical protein [Streptosporangiales bacterium]
MPLSAATNRLFVDQVGQDRVGGGLNNTVVADVVAAIAQAASGREDANGIAVASPAREVDCDHHRHVLRPGELLLVVRGVGA